MTWHLGRHFVCFLFLLQTKWRNPSIIKNLWMTRKWTKESKYFKWYSSSLNSAIHLHQQKIFCSFQQLKFWYQWKYLCSLTFFTLGHRKPRQLTKQWHLKIVDCIIPLHVTCYTSPRLCCILLTSALYYIVVRIWVFDVQ